MFANYFFHTIYCIIILYIIIYRLISVDTHLLLVIKVITVNPQYLCDLTCGLQSQGRNPQA